MKLTKQKMIHGDNLSKMKKMDDKSVDIVFYDPPFNAKKKYDGFDDNLEPDVYLQWMKDIWNESERISRNGVIVFIGQKLVRMFQKYIVPDDSHLIIVHKKAAGVFGGGYMLQYHAIFSTVKPIIKCKDLWDDIRLPGEGYFFREPRYDHPGLTGLSLTERVIHHFTKEGDTILDPFAGTGTTMVACKKMNRLSIGIEQSEKYIEIAKGRLNAK